MRAIRVHVAAPLAPGLELALPPAAATHVARVLRLRAGAELTLFNGDGRNYFAHLLTVGTRDVRVRVEGSQPAPTESPLGIVLAQALARGEKMDWVVQKATELGAVAIQPLVTARSEVRLDDDRADRRRDHWQAIALAACEQCGRSAIPVIGAPQALPAWLATLAATAGDTRLVLHPDSAAQSVRKLHPGPRVILVVGPEGGFADADLAALDAAAFVRLSLGPRILRTETAGLAAIAALQALYGDA